MRDQIHLCEDAEALARHACNWLAGLIESKLGSSQDPFVLALSGGSTPKRLYQLLSATAPGTIDWQRVLLVWGDERNVPPEDVQSNYRMVKESLLDRIRIPAENVLPVPDPGGPPTTAAESYEALLRQRLPHAPSGFPQLDCVLLGLGDDVHTASLFPGSAALAEPTRLVAENYIEKLKSWRITFTPPLINSAVEIAFLVAGESKQSALKTLWHAPFTPELYPAQLIRPPHGRLSYLVDKAAVGSVQIPESAHVEIVDA